VGTSNSVHLQTAITFFESPGFPFSFCGSLTQSTSFYNQKASSKIISSDPNMPVRAGLKPMQLHWAPRLWGTRAMVFGWIIHFCQIHLCLRIQ